MLHEFLTEHRDELIARTRAKVAARQAPRASEEELKHGPPLFLAQLVETLRRTTDPGDAMIASARIHGGELLKKGFTVGQVVHAYGSVCQAVTELAVEKQAPITTDEFRTLNGCLDDAIADAVTEFTRQRERSISAEGTERLGVLAHGLRNKLSAAMLAFEMLKTGAVGVSGSTGAILGRNLQALRDLIDLSLADVRLQSGLGKRDWLFLRELIEELEIDASMEANTRQITLTVSKVDPTLEIDADRSLLAAAVANLLQNAIKFTRPGGHVKLDVLATETRVFLDIQDECGGLPPGASTEMFRPYVQRGDDRSGVGLGLTIARQGIEANGGSIHVRDLPGVGCIFTVELPRQPPRHA